MYLAGALCRQGRHKVKIIDTILNRYNADDITRIAVEYRPDIIGMTVYTPTLYDTLHVSEKLRKAMPEVKIIWGGPHTTLFPKESMEHNVVDYLILGEAEETFPDFCDALEENKPLDNITGILYRKDGSICQTGKPAYIKNIDSLALPAVNKVDFKRYFSAVGTDQTVGTICSSRGCPFQCTFCCKPYSTYRSRSVENIIEEIHLYYELGVREFFFFDDLFNITAKRVKNISEAILVKGWKISWSFRGRVDAVDEEIFRLAKKAGCRQIFFGVEAGTDEGLLAIKKNITISQVKRAVALTRKAGIVSSTNWIIGFPHQKTVQDILDLIEMAIKVDSDYAQFNICIAYHGTEIFNEGIKLGIFNPDIWRDYAKNPVPNFVEPMWEQHLSREELSKLLKLCYHRFYFRLKPIIRRIVAIRSLREIQLHIKGALILLGVKGYHRKKHREGIEDISGVIP
jgi:anaerobic magnesium-protoporphyrin IX monomethyl ester cyclase